MRPLLLAGTSLLALSASIATASASPTTFGAMTVGAPIFQIFTVPSSGLWAVVAFGAQGGPSGNKFTGLPGGLGAEAGGDFQFTAGETLSIAVGGMGIAGSSNSLGTGQAAGGGGGGTFVLAGSPAPGNTLLMVAGGGGGGGTNVVGGAGDGLAGTAGGAATYGGIGGAGGTNGNGGDAGNNGKLGSGGGGAGFKSGGGSPPGTAPGAGGAGFPGLAGGKGAGGGGNGGFGGGGAGYYAGGGGGGYSGGGGGAYAGAGRGIGGGGGGGGSFVAAGATDRILMGGVHSGDGSVSIGPVITPPSLSESVPEPASLALFGTGLAGLLALRRRRRR